MLKRKWARASIVLMGSGLTMLLVDLLLGEIVLFVSEVSIRWMISCGITLVLLGGFCHLFTSNCPHCGGIGPKPRWSYWDDEYCPRCGRVYPYDDRPGGPPKGKPEARPPLTLDRKPARRAMLLLAAGLLCLAAAGMIPTGFPHRGIWGPDEELRYAKLLLTLSGAGLLLVAWRLCSLKLRCPVLPELRYGIVFHGGPPNAVRKSSAKERNGEGILPAAPINYPPGASGSGGGLVPLVREAPGYL